jgi:hypothetical protein
MKRIAMILAFCLIAGCWGDDEDEPYIEPDAFSPLCGPACPDVDAGADGGEDAGE